MSCFTCDDCLQMADYSKCGSGISIDTEWVNNSGGVKKYKVVWSFHGQDYSHEFDIENGAEVIIPDVIQHSYVVELYVLDGDTKLTTTVEATEYDCFRLKIASPQSV